MTVFTPVKWASGLGVMTLPLQGRDRQFNSGLAHLSHLLILFMFPNKKNQSLFFLLI